MQDTQTHIDALLKACLAGSETAQFQIYDLYYKAMFNSALRILQDSFQAEDVMQEAFLSAFTKLHTFKGEVPFGAWLKRIVINRSLTAVKNKNRLQEVKLDTVEYSLEDVDDGLAEEDRTDYNALKTQQVLQAMEQLKPNYRVILNLSLIEGYDNEEITKILNISNENCRTTISRAKNKLRNLLADMTAVN